MAQKRRTNEYTLRSSSSVISFWVGAALMSIVIGVSLLRGDWAVLAFAVAPALLLVWVLWIMLYRPAVRYDASKVVVVNIGRTHLLPWHHVTSIRQRMGVDFGLDSGRVVKAVAVPPPRGRGNVARNFDRRTRPADEFSRNAEILEGFRRGAAPGDEPVVSRWDIAPLAIGAVLVVAVVVEALVRL